MAQRLQKLASAAKVATNAFGFPLALGDWNFPAVGEVHTWSDVAPEAVERVGTRRCTAVSETNLQASSKEIRKALSEWLDISNQNPRVATTLPRGRRFTAESIVLTLPFRGRASRS